MPVEVTKKYVRIRVRDPRVFAKNTFRTHDMGRKGHSRRIAGIRKKTGMWETQAYLILRSDIKKLDPRALRLLKQIKDRHRITVNLKKVL